MKVENEMCAGSNGPGPADILDHEFIRKHII